MIRLADIKLALYVRIIVNDDDKIIKDNEEEQFMGENGLVEEEEDTYDDVTVVFGALQSKLSMRMCSNESVPSPHLLPLLPLHQ